MDTRYHITQDNQKWDVQSAHLEKDLGVLTFSHLAVSRQCMEASSKARRVLGMVRRQFKECAELSDYLQEFCQASLRICHTSLVTVFAQGY